MGMGNYHSAQHLPRFFPRRRDDAGWLQDPFQALITVEEHVTAQ
jgi:hypothetical protein